MVGLALWLYHFTFPEKDECTDKESLPWIRLERHSQRPFLRSHIDDSRGCCDVLEGGDMDPYKTRRLREDGGSISTMASSAVGGAPVATSAALSRIPFRMCWLLQCVVVALAMVQGISSGRVPVDNVPSQSFSSADHYGGQTLVTVPEATLDVQPKDYYVSLYQLLRTFTPRDYSEGVCANFCPKKRENDTR